MILRLKKCELFINYRDGSSDRLVIDEAFYGYRMLSILKEDSIIIDIGAHIGIFSMTAALIAKKGKIYAFEPHKESFELLKINILDNKFNNIDIFNCAVFNEKIKEKYLYLDSYSPGSSTLINNNTNNYIIVPCVSLREIFDTNNINKCNYLKLDAEGSEYEILYALPDNYFNKIDFIGMEYHNCKKYSLNASNLKEYLINKGYTVEIEEITPELGFLYAYSRNVS